VSRWRLDCADAARLPWPSRSVNLIATSPRYNLGLPYVGVDDRSPYGDYLRQVHGWSEEMFRVAADQGRACINVPLDTHNGGRHPVYSHWVYAMQAAGWEYRTTIVWTKGGGQPTSHLARGSIDNCSGINVVTGVEMVAVFSKGSWIRQRRGRHSDLSREEFLHWTDGLWDFPPVSRRPGSSPARWPAEMPRRLIKLHAFVEDVVADPFAGSGTTLFTALELGRECWANDLSEHYVADIQRELNQRKEERAA
jgi:site-specific DNA-methyltransferase (adenine-specific)